MGFAFMMENCGCCGHLFSYNPKAVPSFTNAAAEIKVICQQCITTINTARLKAGRDAFVINENAYESFDESELDR